MPSKSYKVGKGLPADVVRLEWRVVVYVFIPALPFVDVCRPTVVPYRETWVVGVMVQLAKVLACCPDTEVQPASASKVAVVIQNRCVVNVVLLRVLYG